MSEYIETVSTEDANAVIDSKLRKVFDGRIVRKDLTKKIKEGANVPVYVLEFLLGQYCSSDDEDVIETGANDVYQIRLKDGRQLLLPAIKDCVLDVDVEAGRMKIHILDGLLED